MSDDNSRFHIVVADDEESIRSIVGEVLEDEGYTVAVAADGKQALEAVEKGGIHVVITDIRMPEMTGIELLEAVKKHDENIEVIIMTSHASIETAIKAIRLGAYDYLTKPFEDLNIIPTVVDRTIHKIKLELEVKSLLAQLEELAIKDELTGLYNRRHFQNTLETELTRASRFNNKLSMILFDVDHFKNYNDTNGHVAGDQVLKQLGALLRESGRELDLNARYGGEEFAIILVETDKNGAAVKAEKVRKAIEESVFEHQEKQPLGNLTISGGFAEYPSDADNAEALIQAADEALYRAKEGGRNQLLPAGKS